MKSISVLKGGPVQRFGLAAVVTLMLSVASHRPADAMSLINPGAARAASQASEGLLTDVRAHGGGGGGGHFGGFHGGGFHGGGFHGGGFHGGGFRGGAFRGGGFRVGGLHPGGMRFGGYRYGGNRFYRHHFHRRAFYGGPFYYGYPHHRCRIVWTYYGPRRVCHWHRWHHWGLPFPLPFW